MEASVISGILAQALVTLPRIKMSDLFDLCKNDVGNTTLAQFRVEVAEWISKGATGFSAYESRKGPTGGIYKKGAPNDPSLKQVGPNDLTLDPTPTLQMLQVMLIDQPRMTVRDLYSLMTDTYPGLTENQFRPLLAEWIDKDLIPGYELRKGPTGGVYKVDAVNEKPMRTAFDTDSTEESEGSFTLEINPTLRIVQVSDRNWVIQKRSTENWTTYFYHPTIVSALNSCVKHILNGEFKLAESTSVNIKDAIKVFKEIEVRILNQLKEHAETVKTQ